MSINVSVQSVVTDISTLLATGQALATYAAASNSATARAAALASVTLLFEEFGVTAANAGQIASAVSDAVEFAKNGSNAGSDLLTNVTSAAAAHGVVFSALEVLFLQALLAGAQAALNNLPVQAAVSAATGL